MLLYIQPIEGTECQFENRDLPCGEPAIWVLKGSGGYLPLCKWHYELVDAEIKKQERRHNDSIQGLEKDK